MKSPKTKLLYTGKFEARCPVNNRRDCYDFKIRTGKTIQVELLLEYFAQKKEERIFQEDLAVEISERFKCDVTLAGWHTGVKIVSEVTR